MYYNSKGISEPTQKMIKNPNDSLHSLLEEINHPLSSKGHVFRFQDYLHWLNHVNDPHAAMSTTNTFITIYVIIGIVISAVLKIVGLWILLYCVNGA